MNCRKLVTVLVFSGVAALAAGTTGATAQDVGAGLLEKFDSWGAYATPQGVKKVCYAMSQPTKREPGGLKRDPGFVFVSFRPDEKIAGEVAFVVGFPVKDETEPKITVSPGDASFTMAVESGNIWTQSTEDQESLVAAMRKGATLKLVSVSQRGNKTTDTYSLKGFSKALDRARAECK
ncbi:MAG: invasion associated locus B family protein [Methylobacteriaceae bacterium]|jgi:invasion protein IalB|nr:invasion associated locus B family protein [Methylobacteriaceae bacterium]